MKHVIEILEILRLPAPGPEPLGLAFDGTSLWVASREAHRLYALDPATWTVRSEDPAPGAPFGITVVGDELRVIVGYGDDDDDRYIYRFVPGHGFKSARMPCPDLSGVQLAFDGDTLFLAQAHKMKIVALDGHGKTLHEVPLDRRPVGMAIVDGSFYIVTADENFANHELMKMDARAETPQVTALASIPFGARGLTYDGSRFWTSHRDDNQIVAFALPE